ncbi:Hypp4460 [Branchiostoma lanceolatum]|uniref:Hypp4460 protein n=1 Tax=Branchiostoma lanceolatum TaxID=7740 RepID=A0A8K0AA01_BRALA|nr:Hypp4460 [Branchiostoma lanceolatum]
MTGSAPEQRPQPLPEASVRDGVDDGVQRPNSAPSLCLKLLYAMMTGSPPEQRPQPLPEAPVRDGVDDGFTARTAPPASA